MVRRQIDAYLTAVKMDPKRRHLFVEGLRDKNFLLWLCGNDIHSDLTVLTVDAVDFATPVSGGNRGRLVEFAKIIEGKTAAIMFFADADYDLLLNRTPPGNVFLTDRRDIEGYIFSERAISKILRLSLCTAEEAEPLFEAIIDICKAVAAIRVFSEENNLKLPFQETNLKRYITKGRDPTFDEKGYVRALLQNGGVSLTRLQDITEEVSRVKERLAGTDEFGYIHGKDIIFVTEKVFQIYGLREGEVERLFWAAVERSDCVDFPNLKTAVNYMMSAG